MKMVHEVFLMSDYLTEFLSDEIVLHPFFKRAIDMAYSAHKNQNYNGKNYVKGHIFLVFSLVKEYSNNDLETCIAAILHDVVEDSEITIEQIKSSFNEEIADLVWRVTDEPGNNRKEKKEKTYPKIKENKKARLIKLCDRLVNVQESLTANSSYYEDMYKKEYLDFKNSLYVPGEFNYLWMYLDSLLD